MLKNGKLVNPEVRVETINTCNAKCLTCPHKEMKRPTARMDPKLFRRLVVEAKELGATDIGLFAFGEPLCDKQLEDKVKFCTKQGLRTNITTNGSLLTPIRAQGLMKEGIGDIRFSIHGVNKDQYQSFHKGLKWEKTRENLRRALDIRRQGKFKTKIHITSMADASIDLIRAKWERLCDYLEIWKPHSWAGLMNKYGKPMRQLTKERKKTCGRPFSGPVQIQADGRVIPCCFMTNAQYVYGDTNKNTIAEILKGEQAQYFKLAHETGDHTGLPCAKCDQLNIGDEPLLYSNRDPEKKLGRTSSIKFSVSD